MDPLRLRLAPILVLALGLVLVLAARPTSAVTPPGQVWVPPLPDPVVPTNENAEKASKAYKESVKLYEKDDFLGSFEAADRMYQLLPNASTALYRAELLEDLNDPCEALAGFLVSYDLDPTEDEEPDIEAGLGRAGTACAGGYGWARIEVTPPEALVRISNQRVPVDRMVGLKAGDHEVQISAPGFASSKTTLAVLPGMPAKARFDLQRQAAAPAAPVAIPPPAPAPAGEAPPPPLSVPVYEPYRPPKKSNTLAWLFTGGGAALIASGVGVHLWANATREESNDYARPRDDISEIERLPKYNELRDAAKARSITAYALYGGGAAAVTTGVILFLRKPSSEVSWAHVAPLSLPDGGGLLLWGRW